MLLIKLREKYGEQFRNFQNNLLEVSNQIAQDPALQGSKTKAVNIMRRALEPEVRSIEESMSKYVRQKEIDVAEILGSILLGVTIGRLNPAMLPVAAASGLNRLHDLGNAVKSKPDFKLSPVYFLWQVKRKAERKFRHK